MGAALAMQVAALPWRRGRAGVEILLVTSRETRRWIIPKGWPMSHLIDSNAAKREAWEEAGVDGCIRRRALGSYTYEKRAADGSRRSCIVTVFPFQVLHEHSNWPECRQRQRRWFTVQDAAARVAEAELRAIILAFGARGSEVGR
jgi:8-oxo-dGTP pyrophosphatase MutT (NUDIX family)